MRTFSKILVGVGIIAAIAGVGILIGWLGSRGSTSSPPPVPSQPSVDSSTGTRPAPPNTNTAAPMAVNTVSNPTAVPATNPEQPAAATATNILADWEGKVDEVLTEETDDTNKVTQLFEIFPRLPEEGQVEVAQHLSNLVPDDNYGPLGQLLQNAKLPEAVLDVLMADALNRPNAVKLPVLLDVAFNPENAKAGEAKDLLQLYLDNDFGTDRRQWNDALQKWLKENPD